LVGKGNILRVVGRDQLMSMPDEEKVLVGTHRFFRQMAGFIVKQAVRVTGPSDALHQNTKIMSYFLVTYEC